MAQVKKIIAVIILLTCNCPLLSMEISDNPLALDEILTLIFLQLDHDSFRKISRTCLKWRCVADPMWPIWFNKKFPVKYSLLCKKNQPSLMKQMFKKYVEAQIFSESLLDMKTWSPEKKTRLIADDETSTIQKLLTYLEISWLENTGDLIKEPKQMASFFLAHMFINLVASNQDAFKSSGLDFHYRNHINYAYNDAYDIAVKSHSLFDTPIFGQVSSTTGHAAKKDIGQALADALKGENDPWRRYQLAIAFTLAYVAQANFITNYLPEALKNTSIYIDNNPHFEQSKFLKIAKDYTKSTTNPFTQCLMTMLMNLEEKLNLIEQ
jgi:hypothetical protein